MPLLFELECVIDGYNSKASTESPFKTTFKDFDPVLMKDSCDDDSQATWKAEFDITENDVGEQVLNIEILFFIMIIHKCFFFKSIDCTYKQGQDNKTITLKFEVYAPAQDDVDTDALQCNFAEMTCEGPLAISYQGSKRDNLTTQKLQDQTSKLHNSAVFIGEPGQKDFKIEFDFEKLSYDEKGKYFDEHFDSGKLCGCLSTTCSHTGMFWDSDCILDGYVIRRIDNETQNTWNRANVDKSNKFFNRTISEVRDKMLGGRNPDYLKKFSRSSDTGSPVRLMKNFNSSLKWEHMIGPIVDQNWCSMSWAIGSMTVFADRTRISHGNYLNKDFHWKRPHYTICKHLMNGKCCTGNFIPIPWDIIRNQTFAPDNEPSYKFKVGRNTLLPQNVDQIRLEISKNGPVQALMRVHSDLFLYGNGTYEPTAHSKFLGYHSVRIVGWGMGRRGNVEKYFWRIANSWGEEWGENGYFNMWTDTCEIEKWVVKTRPVWENPPARNRDGNIIDSLETLLVPF